MFCDETVSGTSPFIVEEFPNSATEHYQVNMTWSCTTLPAERILPRPVGYSISLDDMGCFGSPAQEIIFRIVNRGGVEWLKVEIYGMPRVNFAVPLYSSPNGKMFNYQQKGVIVRGTIQSHSLTQAVITFDELELNNVSFCSAETYLIPALDIP